MNKVFKILILLFCTAVLNSAFGQSVCGVLSVVRTNCPEVLTGGAMVVEIQFQKAGLPIRGCKYGNLTTVVQFLDLQNKNITYQVLQNINSNGMAIVAVNVPAGTSCKSISIVGAGMLMYIQDKVTTPQPDIVPEITPAFSNENYISTITPYVSVTDIKNGDASKSTIAIMYFDGLGRPMQDVLVGAAPNKNDIIRPITYDALGREDKTYLSYSQSPVANGAYISTALTNQSTFYKTYRNATDAPYAYAQKVFDGSPLNRVVESAAPGNNWRVGNGHTSKIAYSSNVANSVRLWTVDVAGQPIHSNAYYTANTLYVTETTDEDGKKTREYRDKQDRVVESHIDNLRTAYVYNDLGQLAAIVPPKAYDLAVTDAVFKDLVFNYIYDGRGRVIASKTPGATVAYNVYDTRDRLVMSQDGVQRTSNKWTVYKYDALNRPVMEGVVSTTATQAALITAYANTAVNETQTAENYSFATVANAPTLTANGVLKWTYYDDYAWLPSSLAYVAGGFNFAYTGYLTSVKGQITGTKTKVLDGNEETASGQVLRSAVFYDNKYRPVQTVSENYAGGGTTRISTRFSFDGLPEAVLETQVFGSVTNTIAKRMEYDHARRLLKEYHKINAQVEVLLTENVYDELGKLKSKKQNTVETVSYAYNIRDWLTSAKANKFSVDLTYNFNGNIATQIAAGTQYAYTYDAANRLTAGTHSGGFTENGITYDANGNIATLNRVGTSPGAFVYYYTGNKLTSLKVNTTPYAYTYDANGNATKDGYRGMELQYNLLNLPRKVSKVAGTGSVEYVYLASGAKLAKKVNGAFTQFYNGSVVYKGDKIAEYISTSEGLAMKTANGFAYQYNLSDHLGNVRVVLNQDKSVAQSTNYYPFGLAHATSALEKNKYLYNGKEIQSDVIGGTAFGMLDYGARFYDPVIGRWHSIDPLASKYAGLSGYNYVMNNPMKFIDPNGMDVYRYDNESGKMVLTIKNDDKIDQIGRFDYDKKTGEYTVKTNRKGEVKTSIDNIEKGILNDGINFKENNNLIEVGGEGQATVGGVEVFALKLSEFVGNEIGGAYFSKGNSGNTTHMTIGRYKGNDLTTTKSGNGHVAGFKAGLAMTDLTGFFHTHPTIGGDQTNRFNASDEDKRSKKKALEKNPNMTFFILTAPRYSGGEHSFPY